MGVLSYAVFSAEIPEEPIRIMFKSTAGKVLFDHKTHTGDAGYGLSCGDCHHTLEEDEYEDAQSCSECHESDTEEEDVLNRMDALHEQCIGCHQEFEAGPEECLKCHVR